MRVVRRQTSLRFVAVDAAQALCHVPLRLYEQNCDFLIAGCHKWLGAYYPMGMAFYGRPESIDYVDRTLRGCHWHGVVDDPLLRFLAELEGDRSQPSGETVNLTPLFSCHGAVIDACSRHVTTDLGCRQRNANCLLAPAFECGWYPLVPTEEFRSGILLLQSTSPDIRRMAPGSLAQAIPTVWCSCDDLQWRNSPPVTSCGDMGTITNRLDCTRSSESFSLRSKIPAHSTSLVLGVSTSLSCFCGFRRSVLLSPRMLAIQCAGPSCSLLFNCPCRRAIPPTSSRGTPSWPEAGGVHRFCIEVTNRRNHS